MAKIQVDPDVLDQRATDIRYYKCQHDEAISKLNALVDGLSGEWVGSAKTDYVNDYNEFRNGFRSFSERIEEMAKALNTKAGEYRKADNQTFVFPEKNPFEHGRGGMIADRIHIDSPPVDFDELFKRKEKQ